MEGSGEHTTGLPMSAKVSKKGKKGISGFNEKSRSTLFSFLKDFIRHGQSCGGHPRMDYCLQESDKPLPIPGSTAVLGNHIGTIVSPPQQLTAFPTSL